MNGKTSFLLSLLAAAIAFAAPSQTVSVWVSSEDMANTLTPGTALSFEDKAPRPGDRPVIEITPVGQEVMHRTDRCPRIGVDSALLALAGGPR